MTSPATNAPVPAVTAIVAVPDVMPDELLQTYKPLAAPRVIGLRMTASSKR